MRFLKTSQNCLLNTILLRGFLDDSIQLIDPVPNFDSKWMAINIFYAPIFDVGSFLRSLEDRNYSGSTVLGSMVQGLIARETSGIDRLTLLIP